MAHQPQQADGANSHSNSLEQHPSITTELFEQFSHKLLTLHTTIGIIAGPQAPDNPDEEYVEAIFMRDAVLLKKDLAILSAKIDAAHRARRPEIYEGGKDLLRDQDGHVLRIHEHPQVHVHRQSFFLLFIYYSMILSMAMFVSTLVGISRVYRQRTLVALTLGLLLWLGINKATSGKALAVLHRVTTPAWVTLKPIRDKALDRYRRAARLGERMRNHPKYQLVRTQVLIILAVPSPALIFQLIYYLAKHLQRQFHVRCYGLVPRHLENTDEETKIILFFSIYLSALTLLGICLG
jgi:hypothetical protein